MVSHHYTGITILRKSKFFLKLSCFTPGKFNIAPANRPSQKEPIVFQPSIILGRAVKFRGLTFHFNDSGQINGDLIRPISPKCSWGREITLFQGHPGWWTMIWLISHGNPCKPTVNRWDIFCVYKSPLSQMAPLMFLVLPNSQEAPSEPVSLVTWAVGCVNGGLDSMERC